VPATPFRKVQYNAPCSATQIVDVKLKTLIAVAHSALVCNNQESSHRWLLRSFPDLFCYGVGNLGRGVKSLSTFGRCGEALFQRKDPRFRRSLAFVDAFFRMVHDTRLMTVAAMDLRRFVMRGSSQKWSELEITDIIRAAKDEAHGFNYANKRFSEIVSHSTRLLKHHPTNIYSTTRLTDMMWGRIIIWSLPSVLLSITVSPDNIHLLNSIAGPESARTFGKINGSSAWNGTPSTDPFLVAHLLSATRTGCVTVVTKCNDIRVFFERYDACAV
jgi:hypothetical protein